MKEMVMTVKELAARLKTYPGSHPYEAWKTEPDLNKCTDKEKEAMAALGVTPAELMAIGLNRGEVHHILFGYRFA